MALKLSDQRLVLEIPHCNVTITTATETSLTDDEGRREGESHEEKEGKKRERWMCERNESGESISKSRRLLAFTFPSALSASA